MDSQRLLEERRLTQIKEVAQKQLDLLKEETEKQQEDISSGQTEIYEETSHSISNLWYADNFEQLVELSQFATMVSDNISGYEENMRGIRRLETQLKSPYFARIDFKFGNEDPAERIYIGRFALVQDIDILVYDWRSPIASMFYRFGLGKASFKAPVGIISGEISLKRQFEIKRGTLEYFFDADIEILDEFLRKLLSQNASPQMKSIVETIQRDQDVVIRDIENDVLIVQGVAGSGKTSIALHRVAYLMYSGLANKLTSQCIVILSPHAVFEQYISNVLPELGEESVNTFLIDELFEMILKTQKIQTKNQLFEAIVANQDHWIPVMKSSLEFKTSRVFIQVLDALDPPKNKLADVIAAYKKMFYDRDYFFESAKGVPLPENIEEIIHFTQENLHSSKLFFDDASALSYLYLKHNGYDEFRHIKQVVIDEAQDYYAIHFEILKLLFPNARHTILGDVNQTIEKDESVSFYEEIKSIFNKRKSSFVSLNKSFRCTNEILQFSAKFIDAHVEAFGRQGEAPSIFALNNEADLDPVANEIGLCKQTGYRSIGIICKTDKDCTKLFDRLSKLTDVSLIRGASNASLHGVFILPVYLSKGLEFDAAIIWDASAAHYSTPSDKKLLYIGCTRALHRLSLFYWGAASPFVL